MIDLGLESEVIKSFGMSQTFAPRARWLVKGYRAVCEDAAAFANVDATSQLGVGKNMVTAILHWCLAFGLVEPLPREGSRRKTTVRDKRTQYRPTDLGNLLLDDHKGCDPFLEDLSSLWILHLASLRKGCRLPVHWLTFNFFPQVEFASLDVNRFVTERLSRSKWQYSNANMITRDVDVLLKTYSNRRVLFSRTTGELLDDPFSPVRLMSYDEARRVHRIHWGPKPGLSRELIIFAASEVIERIASGEPSVSVNRVIDGPSRLGSLLKIGAEDLLTAWNEMGSDLGLKASYPAGVPQLSITRDCSELRAELLRLIYPQTPSAMRIRDPFSRRSAVEAKRSTTRARTPLDRDRKRVRTAGPQRRSGRLRVSKSEGPSKK
jgi:hypothetical protein